MQDLIQGANPIWILVIYLFDLVVWSLLHKREVLRTIWSLDKVQKNDIVWKF